jgi:endogenous inhibitor of DNA gyrase (YacG/DUF329 family)
MAGEDTKAKRRVVNCPQCGKATPWTTGNPWRPFCSERCKMIDLGQWASGAYRIPVETPPDGAEPAPE